MPSINSVSNSQKSSYNGFSGMVSGMDTESMVDKMLSGTQMKIDRQKGKMQQLRWKQELYRDVISSVRGLKDNFFDLLKPQSNINSNGFFQSMSAVSKSDKVSVIASPSAQAGSLKIKNISSLASYTTLKSAKDVTSNAKMDLSGVTIDKYNKLTADGKNDLVVGFKVDGVEKKVNLKGIKTAGLSDEELKTAITEKINATLKTVGVGINNGQIVDVDTSSSSFKATSTRNVVVEVGNKALADMLGTRNGASNQIRMSDTLKDINFNKELQGGTFEFSINGEKFSFSENETIGSVIDKINSSNADVDIKYSSLEDKFVMTAKGTGAGYDIKITQEKGNLMSALFGVENGKSVTTAKVDLNAGKLRGNISEPSPLNLDEISKNGGVLRLNVDGKDYDITIDAKTADSADAQTNYTQKEITDKINEQLKNHFGEDANGKQRVSLDVDSQGAVALNYEKGMDIKLGELAEGETKANLATSFGLKELTEDQMKQGDVALTNFGFKENETIAVGDKTITVSADTKLSDIISVGGKTGEQDNISFDVNSKTFTISGVSISSDNKDAMKSLFGQEEIVTGDGGMGSDVKVTQGENAKFTVVTADNTEVQMEKNSNSFTIDGLNITLKGTTTTDNETIEIETTRDTKQIFDGIVKFVDEYNSMVDKLNGYLTEKPEYATHDPLTDKQREELSETEQELWDKKSKEGLLRGDSTINSMLTDLRATFYHKPAGSSLALYDIGITTTTNWREGGKLVIDETKLRTAIEENPGEIQKLFVGEDGISKNMEKVLDEYTRSSVANPGRLIEKAGIKGYSENKNQISTEIDRLEKGLRTLELRYEAEKTRYWGQFTQMEKVLQQMSAQSGWLMQQFQ